MKRSRPWKSLLAVALLGAAGMVGCTTTKSTSSDSAPRAEQATPTTGWPSRRSSQTTAWSGLAYPTGDARTSAIGIEKGVPREVRLNGPFDYEIVVTNLSSTRLEGVTVIEELGDSLRINGSQPSGTAEDGRVTWTIGSLNANESRTIRINATALKEGTVGSCAAVTYNSLLCATIPVVQPNLRLTKSGPADVLKCDEIEYTFVVTNTGTGTINNVRISDPLPAGLTTLEGARTINFTVESLSAGQSHEFSAKVMAAERGRFTNKATASADGLTAESAEVVTTVREPVLQVAKTGRERQFLGRPTAYEITVTNTGDGEARETVLVDPVPAGAEFVSASAGGTLVEGRVRWNLGTLRPDESRTVSVSFVRETLGTLRNEVTASAYCAAATSAVAQTVYEGIPALLLDGFDDPDPIEVGGTTTYTLTVTNQGSADLTNVRFVCRMDENENMAFVSATGATPAGPVSGTARGLDITFPAIARLAPGASATYNIVIRATKAGQASFRAEAVSAEITRPLIKIETTNFYQ